MAVIFGRDLVEKVLAGEKTVTRRPVKRDAGGKVVRCTYEPGRSYAVQDARGGRSLGRIRIVSCYRETLRFPLVWEEARLEGFDSPAAFEARWLELYGPDGPRDVWRIVFRLAEPGTIA